MEEGRREGGGGGSPSILMFRVDHWNGIVFRRVYMHGAYLRNSRVQGAVAHQGHDDGVICRVLALYAPWDGHVKILHARHQQNLSYSCNF